MNHKLYPPDWEAIASQIKAQVNWCCEFCGQACIHSKKSVEELCDRTYTTDNANKYSVVADFRAFPLALVDDNGLSQPRQTEKSHLCAETDIF